MFESDFMRLVEEGHLPVGTVLIHRARMYPSRQREAIITDRGLRVGSRVYGSPSAAARAVAGQAANGWLFWRGLPADLESARMLAKESKDGRYEFQSWALGRIDAKPVGGERKKGADRGIDGIMTFSEHDSIQRILVSVKSGKPSVLHVKELIATLTDQGGAIGVLIELDPPPKR